MGAVPPAIGTAVQLAGKADVTALAALSDRAIRPLVRSGAPTPTDIPTGTFRVVKDTSTGRTAIWINDGGTLVDLLNGKEF